MLTRTQLLKLLRRHGTRLDAADKNWHLTSPTPYDPPLTYGGWSQCQALGARIGSILQAREGGVDSKQAKDCNTSNEGDSQPQSRPRKRKRQRVIIHSSPFIRCIQTSVAISAGIGQYEKRASGTIANPISENSEGPDESVELASDPSEFLPTKL